MVFGPADFGPACGLVRLGLPGYHPGPRQPPALACRTDAINGGGSAMERDVKYLAPGEGPQFAVLGGDLLSLKAAAEDTGGAFAVFETTVPPQGGPPPHIHHREDESFY